MQIIQLIKILGDQVTTEILLQTESESEALLAAAQVRGIKPVSSPVERKTTNSRPVVVLDSGETSLKPGDRFNSAREACAVLGVPEYTLAQALSKAKAKGENTAMVSGVTFVRAADHEAQLLEGLHD